MSEYQYYEFQAIDRPLTKQEMEELRAISSRASITPTCFINIYNYGDFRGDPLTLMERYFDAFVYVANWGTRWHMLRLPAQALDAKVAAPYGVEGKVCAHRKGDSTIVEFRSDDEEQLGWVEGEEDWLPSLLPLRDEIARGDLRALYLGWLLGAQSGELDDEEVEPPVPPGIGKLSDALKTLATFLYIDEDLIAVAAERSLDLTVSEPDPGAMEQWIRTLPVDEKDALLSGLATDDTRAVQAGLRQRFRRAWADAHPLPAPASPGRTVGELLSAATAHSEARRRQEAEREERERLQREREAAAARARYLDDLATRVEETWRGAEGLLETKRAADYDQSAQLLRDLADVAKRDGTDAAFTARLRELRARHPRKPSFLKRLDQAGLR